MTMLDNVNRALAEIGTRSRLTVVDSSTTEGLYASLLYPMLRDSMLRMGDYDWSMKEVPVVIGAGTPTTLWKFAYEYPANVVRIRQVIPEIVDPFDPVSVAWNLYFEPPIRFIQTKVPLVSMVVTRSDCAETLWDSQFTDAFIRYFASAMTMALENRLEASETILKEALAFAGLANMRDD